MDTAALALMAAGTTMSVAGSLEQGKQAEKLSKQRAEIDTQNAIYARQNAVEQAKIKAEQGRRLLASQSADFAASGVMSNVGSPLVIKSQTQDDINKDISFILDVGNQQYNNYMANASYEEDYGKQIKRQSIWDATSTGLQGFGSVAYMGYEGGMWGKSANKDMKLAKKHGIAY